MGQQRWFHNKSFYVALLCVSAAMAAVVGIITQYIGHNGEE